MPIYTYRCESCGVQFEKNQKFSDAPLTRCPECGKKSLRKVYQPVGIVFKGSGFYSTDHRSPSGGSRVGGTHGEGAHGEGAHSEGAHGEGSHSDGKSSGESKPSSSADSSASPSSSSESKKES